MDAASISRPSSSQPPQYRPLQQLQQNPLAAATAANPPPPPPPQSSPPRPRLPVPSIQTTLAQGQNRAHTDVLTPASAHPSSAPYSLSTESRSSSPMALRNPLSAVSAYNPQEWTRGNDSGGLYSRQVPSSSGLQRLQNTRDASGHEAALPSPPPPYSASPATPSTQRQRGTGLSQAVRSASYTNSEYNSPISATTSTSSAGLSSAQNVYRPTPTPIHSQQQSPTNFPPPPPPPAGHRDRSGSRSRTIFSAIASRARGLDSSSPPNSIDALQQQTNEALARAQSRPTALAIHAAMQPPGARRAASTGCISPPTESSRASQPDANGNHGFALPPPPPRPPPGDARSSSLSRAAEMGDSTNTGSRRTFMPASSLGPVPPTPADWVEESSNDMDAPPVPSLPLDRTSHNAHGIDSADAVGMIRSRLEPGLQRDNSTSSGGGSIRERRSQSRANRGVRGATGEPQTALERSTDPWATEIESAKPANLVLASPNGLGRRRPVVKSKTSPLFRSTVSPETTRQRHGSDSSNNDAFDAAGSSSLPGSARQGFEPTPPFSAGHELDRNIPKQLRAIQGDRGLPTPPSRQGYFADSPQGGSTKAFGSRPVSHILHTPIDEAQSTPPLAPSRSSSAAGKRPAASPVVASAFGQSSLDRFRQFLEREEAAASDREKLELFANFLVYESRIRRDIYDDAFESLGGDVLELTRDMWRPLVKRTRTPNNPPLSNGRATPRNASNQSNDVNSAPLSANSVSQGGPQTPQTDVGSPASAFTPLRTRPESRQNTYQPALSPIPSMAMSTVHDDDNSERGRAPSRWWEASTHASSIGGTRRVERTKRESKYMGLPKEARENLQWDYPQNSPAYAGSSSQFAYGPNEYPPEKVGWHDELASPPAVKTPAPQTPRVHKMDVSRLITLPPPYPRHHPAVNNNHPDLAHIRTTLRTLSERVEATEALAQYNDRPQPPSSAPEAIKERKRELRAHIQSQVASGAISFADAARLEAESEEQEARIAHEKPQRDFDDFQRIVKNTLTPILSSKIHSASASIEMLAESLNESLRSYDPNQTQEEGDEKPELLEKLTLMKWLFEAREQLHRDLFELEGQSDDKYMSVILNPYELSGATDKIAEVQAFFNKDTKERKVQYEQKCLKRFEAFLQTVERNVTRGSEVQLSAFWDIAPSLLEIVQRVPSQERLAKFGIDIPEEEFDENPAYHEHPLQYLYSLLLHAEKSAYQSIESQINLFCLLHEVKSGVMATGSKCLELERLLAGEPEQNVTEDMRSAKMSEEGRLTIELKERVELIEGQWKEALGDGLVACRARIREFLMGTAGWDDGLEE